MAYRRTDGSILSSKHHERGMNRIGHPSENAFRHHPNKFCTAIATTSTHAFAQNTHLHSESQRRLRLTLHKVLISRFAPARTIIPAQPIYIKTALGDHRLTHIVILGIRRPDGTSWNAFVLLVLRFRH